MATNDEEIIEEFIFVINPDSFCGRTQLGPFEIVPFVIQIYVRTISWSGPYTSEFSWEVAATLPEGSSEEEVRASIDKLLNRKKYFKVCQECKKRHQSGYMQSSNCCMGCAGSKYGIVY